jgi:hypothetical protein
MKATGLAKMVGRFTVTSANLQRVLAQLKKDESDPSDERIGHENSSSIKNLDIAAPRVRSSSARVCAALAAILLVLGFANVPAKADQPSIYLVELYRTNQVLVHFFTDPNLTYQLQYANAVGTNGNFIWTTLYTAPNLPFPSHYIIVDTRTDRFRFYRLKVSP